MKGFINSDLQRVMWELPANGNSAQKNVVFNIRMQPPAYSCIGRNQQLKIVTWHKVKGEKKAHDESLSYHRWRNGSTSYQTCLHTNILTFRSGLQIPPAALVTIILQTTLQSCAQDDKQPRQWPVDQKSWTGWISVTKVGVFACLQTQRHS